MFEKSQQMTKNNKKITKHIKELGRIIGGEL